MFVDPIDIKCQIGNKELDKGNNDDKKIRQCAIGCRATNNKKSCNADGEEYKDRYYT